MDADNLLANEDSLSIFGAEDPEWSAARSAEPRWGRDLTNAIELFPSEAEELAAIESARTSHNAATAPDPLADFDSDIDDEIEVIIEPVVPRRTAVRMPWPPARVAALVALTMFMPSTRAANNHSTHRLIAPAQAATIEPKDVRAEEPHSASTDRQTPAVNIPVADTRPKIPAAVATTGRPSLGPRHGAIRPQPNVQPLKAAASERLVTIAPTAQSATYAAPIDSPPPMPRTLSATRAEAAPSVTVASSPIVVPPETSVVTTDTDAVRAVLDRYQTAFSHLDASRAKAIWPAVDEKALGRAFGQLEQQEVVLERCDVKVVGQRAAAACGGRASYVPRVGSKAARVEERRWAFTLRKTGERWIIEAIELAASR